MFARENGAAEGDKRHYELELIDVCDTEDGATQSLRADEK